MYFLDCTLETPAENLALDEALLEQAEKSGPDSPLMCLRIWESRQAFAVLGRSSPYSTEVKRERCDALGVPVLRRVSGGATVLAGPGCLMYAVVLGYAVHPELRMLDVAHRQVMTRHQQALQSLGIAAEMAGTCDLVWQGRKFSGNSLRCLRHYLLYHGTFLYDFDLDLVAECLGQPHRQPTYRAGRSHRDFVTNISVDRGGLIESLRQVWQANMIRSDWPATDTRRLAKEKYEQPSWTLQR